MTKVKAIKLKCLECSEDRKDLKECNFTECSLWVFRLGNRMKSKNEEMNVNYSRSKAIKKYCIWCMNGQTKTVKSCIAKECHFHDFIKKT